MLKLLLIDFILENRSLGKEVSEGTNLEDRWGEEGVPWIIFLVENYFCYLGVHAKFQTHTTNLSGK